MPLVPASILYNKIHLAFLLLFCAVNKGEGQGYRVGQVVEAEGIECLYWD